MSQQTPYRILWRGTGYVMLMTCLKAHLIATDNMPRNVISIEFKTLCAVALIEKAKTNFFKMVLPLLLFAQFSEAHWTIQIQAEPDSNKALARVSELKKYGLPAYLSSKQTDAGKLFRIRVGYFADTVGLRSFAESIWPNGFWITTDDDARKSELYGSPKFVKIPTGLNFEIIKMSNTRCWAGLLQPTIGFEGSYEAGKFWSLNSKSPNSLHLDSVMDFQFKSDTLQIIRESKYFQNPDGQPLSSYPRQTQKLAEQLKIPVARVGEFLFDCQEIWMCTRNKSQVVWPNTESLAGNAPISGMKKRRLQTRSISFQKNKYGVSGIMPLQHDSHSIYFILCGQSNASHKN